MRKVFFFCCLVTICLIAAPSIWKPGKSSQLKHLYNASYNEDQDDDPNGRYNWYKERLQDPVTGEIPKHIRAKEVAFSRTLPSSSTLFRAEPYNWTLLGPSNVGGRTRAFGFDVTDENTMLAGGVSGGVWRTTDGGQSWTKTTAPDQHHSITCLAQDTRPGKTDIWYFGSGELIGNSASESFSANYLGNGVHKSTDRGLTWSPLSATVSGTPQATDEWDRIWGLVTDPSDLNNDVILAALVGQIKRSDDGGQTWTTVLGGLGLTSFFTDINVTSTGIFYATFSSAGGTKGIFRSEDGVNWTNLNPSVLPGTYDRIVSGINPGNEDEVYFLAETPNSGQQANPNDNDSEWNSLWRYTYLGGDGSGSNGQWEDLSSNIPADTNNRSSYRSQGSYDMVVAVKPDDPNVVFIGGTSLFRSNDAFNTSTQITQIGGYKPGTEGPWGYRWENHHPDQHGIFFLPSDPDVMINANDGGLYRTENCLDNAVTWTSISKGYVTSQFYTVAIDHGTGLSDVVMGGLQDNGTQWTNSTDPNADWVSPNLGDGSYCAVADGGGMYYFSRQFARIIKGELDNQGNLTSYTRIDPEQVSGNYRFVNPFTLDPSDNNVMYLPAGSDLWRNNDLASLPLNDEYEKVSTGWEQYTNLASTGTITAIAASKSPAHVVYYGQSNRRIYRIDGANTGDPVSVDVTNNIGSGNYTSWISIDPRDADKVLVVYSNYNVISLWYTEDGGQNWVAVSGNLEEPSPIPNAPPGFGAGPSTRCAAIIPVDGGNTVYLVGTSTGLYATSQLEGDSTVWFQQGANSIGNVVVEMIDYRESDGFTAVATHGNGVYTTYITNTDGITGQDYHELEQSVDLNVFPNPARDQLNIAFNMPRTGRLDMDLLDAWGRPVRTLYRGLRLEGPDQLSVSVRGLPAGTYYVRLSGKRLYLSEKLIILP